MFDIALARSDEQAACLALLPEVWTVPAELIAARRDGLLVGALALVWESWMRPIGFPMAVHVIPTARGAGVGRSLIAFAAELIAGETDGLWSFGNVPETGAAADFLRACGFAATRRSTLFEMDGAPFHDHVHRIVERLRRNGRIPADVQTMALRDAPPDEVAWLVGREFPGGPIRLLNRLRRARETEADDIDLDRSTVVVVGKQIAGALLYRWNAGEPVIEANVVAPAWRNSYVNALQLQVATRNGLDGGATRFRFDSDVGVRDSMNLARRGNARLIAVQARFYRAVAS